MDLERHLSNSIVGAVPCATAERDYVGAWPKEIGAHGEYGGCLLVIPLVACGQIEGAIPIHVDLALLARVVRIAEAHLEHGPRQFRGFGDAVHVKEQLPFLTMLDVQRPDGLIELTTGQQRAGGPIR